MQRTDEAFLLATHPLGEADLILTLLAEKAGRVRGVARAARKSRKRFGGSLEPMSRVRVRWFHRGGRDLQRIDSLELVESYAAMQSDPALQAACAVLAEIARSLSSEEQGDPRSFRLLGAVLDALREGLEPWAAVRYYEFWTLRLHGLLPELDACAACGRALGSGRAWTAGAAEGMVCRPCTSGEVAESFRPLDGRERAFLADAAGKPPGAMGPHSGVAGPGGTLEWMLRGALEEFVEKRFRTHRHLRAVTAGGKADRGEKP